VDRIVTRPFVRPRKRVRDRSVVALYHSIRAGLLCEWCHRARGTELNHILHGSNKEDAFWNFVVICHDCHQHPRFGFHGSKPLWTVERALRRKLTEGFVLPREAWAYLEGVDAWPGSGPDPAHAQAIAERIADDERSGRVAPQYWSR